jgi:hypothetical protein
VAKELPHQGAALTLPQAHRSLQMTSKLTCHKENNNKYNKNIQNIILQEKLQINKI